MTPAEIERELRERLKALETDDTPSFILAAPGEAVAALLPWILELVEEPDANAHKQIRRRKY